MEQESAFQAGMIPVSGCGEKQDAGIASMLLPDSAGGRFHMYYIKYMQINGLRGNHEY